MVTLFTKGVSDNPDARLIALLPGYKVDSYETRICSNGSDKLYVRFSRIVAPTMLEVKQR